MEKPVTKFIRVELDHCGGHGSDVNGVFEWGMAAMAIDDPEEMAMEMHRMMHHRSIDHVDNIWSYLIFNRSYHEKDLNLLSIQFFLNSRPNFF